MMIALNIFVISNENSHLYHQTAWLFFQLRCIVFFFRNEKNVSPTFVGQVVTRMRNWTHLVFSNIVAIDNWKITNFEDHGLLRTFFVCLSFVS